MHLNTRFTVLILVSTLGLISCAKDKEAMTDTWKITAPATESSSGQKILLTEVDNRTLKSSTLLHFDPTTTHSTNLSVTSNCHTDSKNMTQTVHGHDVVNVPLISLLPRELLESESLDEIQNAACDLNLTFSNQIGSTHEFTVRNIKIDFSNQPENVRLSSEEKGTKEIPISELHSSLLNLSPAPASIGDWHLKCDSYDKLLSSVEPSKVGHIFVGLIGKPNELSFFNGVLINEKYKVHQTCSLFGAANDPQNGLPVYWIKHDIHVKFPTPMPSIQSFQVMQNANSGSFQKESILSIAVSNRFSQPMVIRFPKHPGAQVYFQGITNDGRGYFRGRPWAASVETTREMIVGSDNVQDVGDEWQIVINGQSAISIKAGFLTDKDCIALNRRVEASNFFRDLPASLFNGFSYAFAAPIEIKELIDFNHSTNSVSFIENISVPVPVAASLNSVLTGWLPLGNQNPRLPQIVAQHTHIPNIWDLSTYGGVPYMCGSRHNPGATPDEVW